MKKILIVSGHPHSAQSFANKTVLDTVALALPEAQIRYLDRLYPDHQIDVEAEQKLVSEQDIIVLQFPFYWFGLPGLLKTWLDSVFVHGFSHGSTGDKVKGKKLLLSFTMGGSEGHYRAGSNYQFPVESFLLPFHIFEQMTQMDWLGTIYTGGVFTIGGESEERLAEIRNKAQDHALRLVEAIKKVAE